MDIFEAIMMLCFGFSWPAGILKTLQTKNPVGKSLLFLYLIEIGYLAGIANKLLTGANWVIWLYIINAMMVGTDIVLVIYKRKRLKNSLTND